MLSLSYMKKMLWLWVGLLFFLAACEPVMPTPTSTTESEKAPAVAEQSTQAKEESTQTKEQPTQVPAQSIIEKPIGPKEVCKAQTSLFSEAKADEWSKGGKDAKVTIIEYSDFMCPYCSMVTPTLMQLVKEGNGNVKVVFRHFPLTTIHDKALLAAQSSEAAGLQDKFWEMHDVLFEKQKEWSALSVDAFTPWLQSVADDLSLDKDQFTKDLTSDAIVKKVQKAFDEGAALGIPGTPTLVINGTYYSGNPDLATLNTYIQSIQKVKQYPCPPNTLDKTKKYKAIIQTDKGDITLELFADKAPITVNSFVFLAKEGYYNGVSFHRVIPNFVAQAGDPLGTGTGGPGYQFINEIAEGLTFGEVGVVGMANAGADTNGSQFFITYAGIPQETVQQLDGNYTIFGKVTSGMDVVEKLAARDPAQNPNLPTGDLIKSIKIEEE